MAGKDADPNLTRRQVENHRASIRVGRLLQLLQDNAEGLPMDVTCSECGHVNEAKAELSPSRVKSIQIALAKVMADQQKIETEEVKTPPSLAEIREELVKMIVEDPTIMKEAESLIKKQSETVEEGNVVVLKTDK